jgi:CRP/FNR family transcriptional regulator, cyclic AMP receptor protein
VLESRLSQDGPPTNGALPLPGRPEQLDREGAGTWGSVRLLDVEPDLAAGLSEPERARVSRLALPAIDVQAGPWSPPASLREAMGVVVVYGQLIRTGHTFARPDIHLLGPGDVAECQSLAHSKGRWRALQPAQLVVLDERFVLAARAWPALMTGLSHRLFEAQEEQHTRAAICAMPRVEERILALLCHLAGRWGHVTTDGVTLTLPVTHELLGALIGSRRPTVSLALKALEQQRLLVRRDDGAWVLPADATQWPTSGTPECGPVVAGVTVMPGLAAADRHTDA